MMDADAMFPEGFHPVRVESDPTLSHKAVTLPRDPALIKYYFIDFGLSVDVVPPISKNKFVVGIFGRDETVPELSLDHPYDAFKVDIYILGNMFKRVLYEVGRKKSPSLLSLPCS